MSEIRKPLRPALCTYLGAALLSMLALFTHPAAALEVDSRSAVIFAYNRIGEDAYPSSSLRIEQFEDQLKELKAGGYTVKPLTEILKNFEQGIVMPPKTVALTFDGGHASFLYNAVPLLEKNHIPYTVFISPGHTQKETGPYVGWDDLRRLKKSGLATIGLHPATYTRLADNSDEEIRRQVNSAIVRYREELGGEPEVFAYPFGEYSRSYRDIIAASGFKAAFGQQSGAAWEGADMFALPRFAMTERYGDIERFRLAAAALPLPLSDIVPEDPHLNTLTPSIGFTVPQSVARQLDDLSCFITGQSAPVVERIDNRIELRLNEPLSQDRVRVNCTLPGPANEDIDGPPHWRWLGLLLTIPLSLLPPEDPDEPLEP